MLFNIREFIRQIRLWLSLINLKRNRITSDDAIVAYYCLEDQLNVLLPESDEHSNATSLPSILFMQPGIYSFEGKIFDCSSSGLYRFSKPQIRNAQRVIVDPDSSFRTGLMLTLLFIRGNKDDFLTLEGRKKKALQRCLINTCGPASTLTHKLLQDAGFDSRIVHTHTTKALNSYNNGHTLLEIFDEQSASFKLIDVDKKCYFIHDSVGVLNLFEFCYYITVGEKIKIVKINQPSLVDWTGFNDIQSGFNYQFIEYLFHNSEATSLELYRRIATVPVIPEDGNIYVTLWDHSSVVINQHKDWTSLSPEAFQEKFYSRK